MNNSAIPTRKGPQGNEIETRPLYIEEWLESLPYIDFEKTCQLLQQALQLTNKQTIKPVTRLELVELYNRPYKYYVESQIRTGAQHTRQTIDVMLQQAHLLKQIAVQLSLSCKLAVENTLIKKTMWKQSKPPLHAMLMSLNYLSHALIFSYLEYAPTPKKVWNELHLIYSFAEGIGKQNDILVLPGYKDKVRGSIEHAYKRIILASLADPYHLPFGAIWEIYDQLDDWAEYSKLEKYRAVDNPTGYFVVALNSDTKPLPYIKFDDSSADEMHRLLDTTPLEKLVRKHVDRIKIGLPVEENIRLTPIFAKSLMGHILKAWGLPPKRYLQRQAKTGQFELICGMNPVYFFCNGQKDFTRSETYHDDDDGVLSDETDRLKNQTRAVYTAEAWQIADLSAGGYALINNSVPVNPVRVGDLVATRSHGNDNWTLGIIRWLMVGKNKTHKIGIQNLAKSVIPGAVRACSGTRLETEYRRALIIGTAGNTDEISVITDPGLYVRERELEVEVDHRQSRTKSRDLRESTASFDYFNCKPD